MRPKLGKVRLKFGIENCGVSKKCADPARNVRRFSELTVQPRERPALTYAIFPFWKVRNPRFPAKISGTSVPDCWERDQETASVCGGLAGRIEQVLEHHYGRPNDNRRVCVRVQNPQSVP